MANIDLANISREIGDILTTYVNQFLEILTNTKPAIKKSIGYNSNELDLNKERENQRLKKAFVYSLISISIGVFLATFLKLSNTPSAQNIGTLVAVLFIWILFSILLHPLLRLFKGRGKLKETIVVFLLIVSTIHLIWIPIISVTSNVLTQTRVYLTYDYIISFSSAGWSRYKEIDLMYGVAPNYVESYIKGNESGKEGTILAPLDTTGITDQEKLLNDAKFSLSRSRIQADSTKMSLPKLSEKVELKSGAYKWISLISLIYYLSNSFYLALGLSIPHKLSTRKLFGLAILGPIAVTLGLFILIVLGISIF